MREEQGTRTPGNATIRKLLTPRQAIHAHCIDCVGSASAVNNCQGDELYDHPCIFFPYRMGGRRPSVKLIRKFCLYCMGGNQKLVRECPSRTCPFLPYRMGKNLEQRMRKGRFKSAKRPPHEAITGQESTIGVVPIS
jgi:hypothetical protein